MISAYVLMVAVYWLFRGSSPSKMDKYFRKFQLLSAAAFSLSHGSNDAQKTAGLITGVLFTSHLHADVSRCPRGCCWRPTRPSRWAR